MGNRSAHPKKDLTLNQLISKIHVTWSVPTSISITSAMAESIHSSLIGISSVYLTSRTRACMIGKIIIVYVLLNSAEPYPSGNTSEHRA